MIEEWRTIPKWPEYEVSSHGRVRRIVASGGAKPALRKPYTVANGYRYVVMRDRATKRAQAVAVHRLVAFAFLGPAPTCLHQVAHWDGDRANNAPSNLRWATRVENEADKQRHARDNRGRRNGRSVPEEAKVLQIWAAIRADGGSSKRMDLFARIGAEHGVAATTVQSIANGTTWAWLTSALAVGLVAEMGPPAKKTRRAK